MFLQASADAPDFRSSGSDKLWTKHLRLMGGLIERNLSLNVLWDTPIANFFGQVFLCLTASTQESQGSPAMLLCGLTVSPCLTSAIVCVQSTQQERRSPTASSQVHTEAMVPITAHLGVWENPGLSVSLAKSSRLEPNSLSNILSLMNKATPRPNALPISCVNWEWNRLVLWKKRKKNVIAQASLACLKPWNQAETLEIKMLPSFRRLSKALPHLCSNHTGRHLWWLQISRLKISTFIYLLYQELLDMYANNTISISFQKPDAGAIFMSLSNFQNVFWTNGNELKGTSELGTLKLLHNICVTV